MFYALMAAVVFFLLSAGEAVPVIVHAAEKRAADGAENLWVLEDVDMPSETEWKSDDGCMKITTGYTQIDQHGNEKYYIVWAKAQWLKPPLSAGKDIFLVGKNSVYNSEVDDAGEVVQVFQCIDCKRKTYRVRSVKGGVTKDGDLTVEYGCGVPELHFKQLSAPVCDYCGSCKMEFDEFSVWLQYGIIMNEASYSQAVYVHKMSGLGDINIRIDENGKPNCLPTFGRWAVYTARPVRIFFDEKGSMMDLLAVLSASCFGGGTVAVYGNWRALSKAIAVIVMGGFILRELKKSQKGGKYKAAKIPQKQQFGGCGPKE